MATDYSISILIDSTVPDNDKAEIVKRVYEALKFRTIAPTNAAAYVAGTRGDQHTLTVT